MPPNVDLNPDAGTNSLELMRRMARTSPCVTFMCAVEVEEALRAGLLAFVPIQGSPARQSVALVHRAAGRSTPSSAPRRPISAPRSRRGRRGLTRRCRGGDGARAFPRSTDRSVSDWIASAIPIRDRHRLRVEASSPKAKALRLYRGWLILDATRPEHDALIPTPEFTALDGTATLRRARVPLPFSGRRRKAPRSTATAPPSSTSWSRVAASRRSALRRRGAPLPVTSTSAAATSGQRSSTCTPHLDKGHIVDRAPNISGDFRGAIDATRTDREANWRRPDLERRMDFALRCAEVHGVTAIRTHLDSYEGQAPDSWAVFGDMRDSYAGRITLQAVALVALDVYRTPFGADLADLVAEGGGLMGGVTRATAGLHEEELADLTDLLDRLFILARARGLDVDLHVDESATRPRRRCPPWRGPRCATATKGG